MSSRKNSSNSPEPAPPKEPRGLTEEQVDSLEKLVGQLDGIHSELSALAKKSLNDAVNPFKLKFINKVIAQSNSLLGDKYRPFDDFDTFNVDDVPSNSDVTLIVSQYMHAIEKLRSDNIAIVGYSGWCYILKGSNRTIKTAPPAKLSRK
jgi:hypothetical protein